jgi:hypothetical protein
VVGCVGEGVGGGGEGRGGVCVVGKGWGVCGGEGVGVCGGGRGGVCGERRGGGWRGEGRGSISHAIRHVLQVIEFIFMCILISLPLSFCRWCVFKHSRPLSEEIVRFPPYLESDDPYRGTTVLPSLEFFYQYGDGTNEEAPPASNDRGEPHPLPLMT